MLSDWKSKFSEALSADQAIAIWRLPMESDIRLIEADYVGIWDGSMSTKELFLFAPFNQNKYPVFAFGSDNKAPQIDFAIPKESSSKENYKSWVETCIKAIKSGAFSKLVGARIEMKISPSYNPILHFQEILEKHPNAFCYLVHSKQTGTWIGASPELLLELKKNQFKTVALAGTQQAEKANFGAKEDQEQEFVVEYIADRLKDFSDELTVSEKQQHNSGHLLHLQSVFTGILKKEISLRDFLQKLHPTPAVAGIPKEAAIDFIEKGEGFDRSYYSGFLGPINQEKSSLFVNLRCLQSRASSLVQYAGAGITKDSIAESEWNETEEKLKIVAPSS